MRARSMNGRFAGRLGSTRSRCLLSVFFLGALLGGGIRSGLAQSGTEAGGRADPPSRSLEFELTFDRSLREEPFSGWVYVMMAESGEVPRLQRSWMNPPPLFSRKVEGWKPGETLRFTADNVRSYPVSLGELEPAIYSVQAVMRCNLDSPRPGRGDGNLASEPRDLEVGEAKGPIRLELAEKIEPRPFTQTDRVRLVDVESRALSEFHGRSVKLNAGVHLPQGWSEEAVRKGARFPVIYLVTGFGGDHQSIRRYPFMLRVGDALDRVILVVPDASCYRGHSVFADSMNNGPWATALVTELVPEIQRRFGGAGAAHRYVTGVSSGGWSSLWLQVTYPEEFAGCWSFAPDPVDFRDFQRIDLYAPDANMYRTAQGERRPLARRGNQVMIYYEDFVRMEEVGGPGGQIHSFEAVFSPRGSDGLPRPLFDRQTGRVDPEVARAWRPYDLRLVLEENWKTLGPKLAGKVRVYGGAEDTFYLEGAVRLLEQSLKSLGSDADVKVFPGVGHGPPPGGFAEMFRAVLKKFDESL